MKFKKTQKNPLFPGFYWVFLGGLFWVFLGGFFWVGFFMPTLATNDLKIAQTKVGPGAGGLCFLKPECTQFFIDIKIDTDYHVLR